MTKTSKEDSVYNFSEKFSNEKLIFKIDSAQHEDFSCLSVIVRESGNCKGDQYFNTISKLSLSFLEDNLKNINSFSQVLEEEMNKTVRRNKTLRNNLQNQIAHTAGMLFSGMPYRKNIVVENSWRKYIMPKQNIRMV